MTITCTNTCPCTGQRTCCYYCPDHYECPYECDDLPDYCGLSEEEYDEEFDFI